MSTSAQVKAAGNFISELLALAAHTKAAELVLVPGQPPFLVNGGVPTYLAALCVTTEQSRFFADAVAENLWIRPKGSNFKFEVSNYFTGFRIRAARLEVNERTPDEP